jgi:hypothetical protein
VALLVLPQVPIISCLPQDKRPGDLLAAYLSIILKFEVVVES